MQWPGSLDVYKDGFNELFTCQDGAVNTRFHTSALTVAFVTDLSHLIDEMLCVCMYLIA